MLINLT